MAWNGNNGGGNRPKKKWRMWDIRQLELRGNPWDVNNPKNYPRVTVGVTETTLNLTFKIYMNRPNEEGGAIQIPLPFLDFGVLGALFQNLESRTVPGKYTFTCRSNYGPGGYSETPVVVGKITVGKNAEGVMYLGFNNGPGKPPAICEFKDSYMAELTDESGEKMDIAELSPIKAKVWLHDMNALIRAWAVHHATEPEQKPQHQGQGYNNRSGGNSGGGGNTSGAFDDDLPY